MPYLAAEFDASVSSTVAAAAADMAANSPFKAATKFLHLTLLSSLHTHSEEEIAQAVRDVATSLPVSGRFLKWSISNRVLRLELACDHALTALQQALRTRLPRGKPWDTSAAHIVVGYLDGIPAAQHAEFLAAVEASYPIVAESSFMLPCLGYHGASPESVPKPRPKVTRQPRAPQLPKAAAQAPQKQQWRRPNRPNLNHRLNRPSTTGTTAMDSATGHGAAPMVVERSLGAIRKKQQSKNKAWSRTARIE